MRIQYVGRATERQWNAYLFSAANRKRAEVPDLETVQEMLTQPGKDFAVSDDDPLAQAVGAERAAELAVFHDVLTVEQYRAWQHTGRSTARAVEE